MKDYKDYKMSALQDWDILKDNIKLMFAANKEELIQILYNDSIFRIRAIAEFNNYRVLATKISKDY